MAMNESEINAWKIFVREYRKFKTAFDKKFPKQASIINKFYDRHGDEEGGKEDPADFWK